jgi:hypothetical protein
LQTLNGLSGNYVKTKRKVKKYGGTKEQLRIVLQGDPFLRKEEGLDRMGRKVLAKANVKGYDDILLGKVTVPKSTVVIDVTDDAGKELLRIQEKNDSGYSDLILSMNTEESGGMVAFKTIQNSKSKDYEKGNIEIAFKNLRHKYAPSSAPNLAKLHKSFYGAKLKKNVNPDIFITYLEDLRGRMENMGSEMTDDQFILHVVNNLTEDYMNQVENLERRIGSETDPLDIEDVREELNLKFERLKTRGKNNSDDDDDEHALFAGGNKSRSKCNHCGKFGHKSADCYSKGKNEKTDQGSKNGAGKFKGDCFYCKKPGHRAADCRKKKKDLEPGDQAATATTATNGKDQGEIVLVTIDQGDIEEEPNEEPDPRSISAARSSLGTLFFLKAFLDEWESQ